ncbi:multiple epidermal growth factor-like domains protein 10 [Crassostrea angulata]|uniref:multiple epidermal growth factor-like domains protein 10 n=1 Tax=Magallana angulata TaxID=2784310 RepID=UPI0022B092FB|nr:multiple epidermal growth factor-like domains protein 10 [Crassostrea angulata]
MTKTLFLFALPLCTFAYENIALHKSAWQLYPYENTEVRDYVNASKAVDGLKTNLSFYGQQCTGSANNKYEAILRVDLGAILGIHSITVYYRTDNVEWGPTNGFVNRFLGFSIYISNTTEIKDGILCFKDDYFTKYTIPSVITLNCTHHGRYVIYYNNRTSNNIPPDYSLYAYNELCEFEVYGCSTPDHFGKNCSLPCPVSCNNSRCHIETGHCFECEDGYQGPKCEQPCLNNTYGAECLKICGQCLSEQQCNHINGTCTIGCETGYYSDHCKIECPAGKYGNNCLQNCSENCYIAKTCDRKTGVCHRGCAVGWKLPFCNEECDDGTFGANCSSVCGHCHQGQSCDIETGTCLKECDSGYEGIYCNKTCAQTYYGPNCNLKCSTSCINKTCDSRSGTCLMTSKEKEIIEGTSSAPAIGGSIGVILVVIAIAVIIIYRRFYRFVGKHFTCA